MPKIVPMTPEQSAKWRASPNGKAFFGKRAGEPKHRRRRMAKLHLLHKWNYRCAYCRCYLSEFDMSEHFPGVKVATLDHVQPVSAGGSDSIFNLVPACEACNSRRRHTAVDTFLDERGIRGEPRAAWSKQLAFHPLAAMAVAALFEAMKHGMQVEGEMVSSLFEIVRLPSNCSAESGLS